MRYERDVLEMTREVLRYKQWLKERCSPPTAEDDSDGSDIFTDIDSDGQGYEAWNSGSEL
jgi:hypothetical protein